VWDDDAKDKRQILVMPSTLKDAENAFEFLCYHVFTH